MIPGVRKCRQGRHGELELREREIGRLELVAAPLVQGRKLLPPLQPLPGPVEIDLPSDQLRGQAHVLTVPADRERELVLVDDRRDDLALGIAEDLRYPGGRERAAGEDLRIRVPG